MTRDQMQPGQMQHVTTQTYRGPTNAATRRRPSMSRSGSVLARTITRGRGTTCPRREGVSARCVSTQTRGHVRSVAPHARSATTLTATPQTTSPRISPSCVAVATCEKTGA